MPSKRLLQLTDLHLFEDPQSTLKGIPTHATLQEIVDWIRQHELEFERLIITGDHTHDELPPSYQAVRQLLAPWLDRLLLVPGNHDDRKVLRSVFGDVIDRQCDQPIIDDDRINFSASVGDWLLLGIDSHWPGEVAGQIGESQLTWLRQQLSVHTAGSVIVFCHHPPVEIGSVWMDKIGITDQQAFVDVLEEFPAIRLICCGHVHHEFEDHTRTARVVTTPSTGIQFDPAGSEPTFSSDPPGYRIIELNGDLLETHVVRMPTARHRPAS